MPRVKLTILHSECRSGLCRAGETFLVEDICPPLCHELWHTIYPMVHTLCNGGLLDFGEERCARFVARCPDHGRVVVQGEVV